MSDNTVGELRLSFEPVVAEDFEALAALREAALRESLERLGLFSQERSRERLRSNFRPQFMRHIVCGGQRVGLLLAYGGRLQPARGVVWHGAGCGRAGVIVQ